MLNIFKRLNSKLILFLLAVIIGSTSLFYTNKLVKKISDEERKKITIWAEAYKEIQTIDLDQEISLVVFNIIYENKTIPVILLDDEDNIIAHSNLDSLKSQNDKYLREQLEIMKEQHEPIVIDYYQGHQNYIYYKDSFLLSQLFYYPYIQFTVILLFIIVSYFAFKNAQKAEENQLWVGMSKETAHQLGTPISSLLAWVELLKMKDEDTKIVTEVEKDVERLETITERFSKIGSKPVLKNADIYEILDNSITYIKTRTSNQVNFILDYSKDEVVEIPINKPLFEWVIENICKNAIDAMSNEGTIKISVFNALSHIMVDISDTGKGISKRNFKKVFNAGFTTKKRGWGLGLSLAKRIIEIYHAGKIFVKNSEIGKGTTFRIILNK